MVTYTPRAGFIGSDSFRFRANDGIVDSAGATVTISVAEGRYLVNGTVRLEGMEQPLTGAIVTISAGSQESRVFSDPESGYFEVRLLPESYDITVEKDGFLTARQSGVVVSLDIALPELLLLWGDTGNGIMDVGDLLIPAKNLGKTESHWPPVETAQLVISLLPLTQTVSQGTPADVSIQLDPSGAWVDGAEISVSVLPPLELGGVTAGEGVTLTGIRFGPGVIEFSVTFDARTSLLPNLATIQVNTPTAVSPEEPNVVFLNTEEQRTVGTFEGGDVTAALEAATIVVTP